jgi:dolichol kinase
MWSVTTPFIKTYRLPTPLLIFQLALIMGSLLTGFLLSPLLVLSRHIAQRPVRRLRFPQEKPLHRRALAAGFYIGAVLIVGGLIGIWTRWCLGSRDPWLWVLHWLLEGKKIWTRPILLLYWGLLCCISVAAWNRQLARSRKYWSRNTPPPVIETTLSENVSETSDAAPSHGLANGGVSATLGLPFPTLPNGKNVSDVATDLLDAADKHVPTLSLNARRKFFHVLAVVMFLPGIIIDVRAFYDPCHFAEADDVISSPHLRTCHSAWRLLFSLLRNTSATLLCTPLVLQFTCS